MARRIEQIERRDDAVLLTHEILGMLDELEDYLDLCAEAEWAETFLNICRSLISYVARQLNR